jgi:hypothetical protein
MKYFFGIVIFLTIWLVWENSAREDKQAELEPPAYRHYLQDGKNVLYLPNGDSLIMTVRGKHSYKAI